MSRDDDGVEIDFPFFRFYAGSRGVHIGSSDDEGVIDMEMDEAAEYRQVRRIVRRRLRFVRHLFVYLALVLATPGAGWRRLVTTLAAGGALIFAIDVGMLMNDLQSSERSLFPDAGGPFPAPIALIGGLHDTAGAGILPVVLWTFFLAGPALARARASPDARALQPGDDRADASADQ